MRYNKASLDDTIRAARETAARAEQLRFVFATAYGFRIETRKPPFGQAHLIVWPSGRVEEIATY